MAHAPIGMILAAGYGSRLKPLSLLRPKPIMEVAGKPMVYFLIRMLEQAGIKDIILNLHYQSDQIRQSLAKYHFKSRLHLIYEREILNTAGGVANAIRQLQIENRPMVIIHGDIFCSVEIARFLHVDNFASLLCCENRRIEGYEGMVGADRQGRIVKLGKYYATEMPSLCQGFFTGIQLLSPSAVLELASHERRSLVADVYPRWLRDGRDVRAIIEPLAYNDLGTAERLFDENMLVLKTFQPLLHLVEGYSLSGDGIFVGKSAKIDDEAELKGPVIIAEGAQIDAGAVVGPNVIVGERSLIGPDAVVMNTVVMSDTTIDRNEFLDCTIAMDTVRVNNLGGKRWHREKAP